MIALIDMDVVAYKAAASVQSKWYNVVTGDDIVSFSRKRDMKEYIEELDGDCSLYTSYDIPEASAAVKCCDIIIKTILNNVGTSKFEGYLTGDYNFREKVATRKPYKGNRVGVEKPVWLDEVRGYLSLNRGCQFIDGKEADDELGIAQTRYKEETIICTVDKDLRMIPGKHYNIDSRVIDEVEELDGLKFFYTQCLTGDSVDNIPGLYNWSDGKVKATKELKQNIQDDFHEHDMLTTVLNAYLSGLGDVYKAVEAFTETARLLWIQRSGREEYVNYYIDRWIDEWMYIHSDEVEF